MKFILNKDKIAIEGKITPNSGSVKYYEAEVGYDESWEDLTIEAVLVEENSDTGKAISLIGNKLYIDNDMEGSYEIGFVGYTIENETKVYQISTNLKAIKFNRGAGQIETSNEDIPTPTEWEIYIAQIQDMIQDVATLPTGGTTGQALVKKSNADGDLEWATIEGGGGSGTSDYNELSNKPSINNVTLNGNKSLNDLGIINFSGNYNDLSNKPFIPSEVTENTVSGWGFTKNTGTYSKPSGGIPKSDLASDVQTSLGKADTAIQSHQDISGKLDTSKVKNTNSTTAGDVYDVTYINSMIGNIETLLGGI